MLLISGTEFQWPAHTRARELAQEALRLGMIGGSVSIGSDGAAQSTPVTQCTSTGGGMEDSLQALRREREALLAESVRLEPDNALTRYMLGSVYQSLASYDVAYKERAESELGLALQFYPSALAIQERLASVWTATWLPHTEQELLAAIELCDQSVTMSGGEWLGRLGPYKCQALISLGRHGEAVHFAEHMLADCCLCPGLNHVVDIIGTTLRRLAKAHARAGEAAEAVGWFEMLRKLATKQTKQSVLAGQSVLSLTAMDLKTLGDCYLAIGNQEGAQEAWTCALSEGASPRDPSVLGAKSRLRRHFSIAT